MSTTDIIRAWRDPGFRNKLSPTQRSLLPEHPAGLMELTDNELDAITGGTGVLCSDPGSSCTSHSSLVSCCGCCM